MKICLPMRLTRGLRPIAALMRQSDRAWAGAWPRPCRADQMLVDRGLVESRARGQALILAGLVFSGERKIDKAGPGAAARRAARGARARSSVGIARRRQAGARPRAFRLGRGGRGGDRRRLLDRRLYRRAADQRRGARLCGRFGHQPARLEAAAGRARDRPRADQRAPPDRRADPRADRPDRLRRELHRPRQGAGDAARLRRRPTRG